MKTMKKPWITPTLTTHGSVIEITTIDVNDVMVVGSTVVKAGQALLSASLQAGIGGLSS
jgi:hypothetical protein